MKNKKLISIVTPTYNEQENIQELYNRISKVVQKKPEYNFEIIVIDNASTDNSVRILKEIACVDKKLKIIRNNKNYGHTKSPYWGILQANGDAIIFIASDLQDPPEVLLEMISEWELGAPIVLGTKQSSNTNFIIHNLRKIYYRILKKYSHTALINDANGFGVYDKKVIEWIRLVNDPNPYFRGLVCESGYPIKTIKYKQDKRHKGVSKNNIFTLYDMAIMGFVNYSYMPIRLISMLGFLLVFLSIVSAVTVVIIKIIFWKSISFEIVPLLLILITFIMGIQFAFIGIIGEYLISLIPHIKKRPIVNEMERINF
jgi:glycosyltransferase involved in cell wall biosynthesis